METPTEITDHVENNLFLMGEVFAERRRQLRKWGVQTHSPAVWLAILGEEFGEACKAALEHDAKALRAELIQVAAVALAIASGLEERENEDEE